MPGRKARVHHSTVHRLRSIVVRQRLRRVLQKRQDHPAAGVVDQHAGGAQRSLAARQQRLCTGLVGQISSHRHGGHAVGPRQARAASAARASSATSASASAAPSRAKASAMASPMPRARTGDRHHLSCKPPGGWGAAWIGHGLLPCLRLGRGRMLGSALRAMGAGFPGGRSHAYDHRMRTCELASLFVVRCCPKPARRRPLTPATLPLPALPRPAPP